MASSRRKQDEKHLKILREFVSKQENRTCFDCHQKGPTYVNMTIGSFICTSCSGILRGLNPPHRVKSISMASFTSEEVEQIKLKGNQYCQSVWLGLYDGKSNLFPDKKDEHKIRDFMISKYERKRFYVDPSVAFKNGNVSQPKSETSSSASTPGSENRTLGSSTTPNSATSVSRPVASVQNSGSSPSLNGLHQSNSLKLSSSVDLLSRLSSNSPPKIQQQAPDKDPFRSPPTSQPPTEGFANFENANIFSSASISKPPSSSNPPRLPFSSNFFTPLSSSSTPKPVSTSSPSNVSTSAGSLSVSEDRYAALKDLDEAFKVQKEVDKPSGNNSVMFGSPPAGTSQQPQSGNPVFGTPPMNSSGGGFYPNSSQGWNATFPPPVNPFSGNSSSNANVGSGWPNSSNFGSLSTQAQPQVNPFAGGADPNFNSQFVPGFGPAPSNHNVSHLPAFGSSSNLPNGSTNPWGSHSPPNPFSAPPAVVPSGGSSYNPFL